MCGIAGFFDAQGTRDQSPDVIEAMTNSLHHRGPDAFGYHREPGVALGHRRLSIIDLSGSNQPIYNEEWQFERRIQRRDLQLQIDS